MRYAQITIGKAQPWIIGDDAISRGPGARYIVAGWPGFEQLTQSIPYLEAPFQSHLAWGNRTITFALLIEHEFADESENFLFTCTLAQNVRLFGQLEMGVRGSGGGKVVYPNAMIRSVVPAINAEYPQVTSMRLLYNIIAGAAVVPT